MRKKTIKNPCGEVFGQYFNSDFLKFGQYFNSDFLKAIDQLNGPSAEDLLLDAVYNDGTLSTCYDLLNKESVMRINRVASYIRV